MNLDENNMYAFTTKDCENFVELIIKYCKNLSTEKNFSEHTIRNYKNDLEIFNIWCDRNKINPLSINCKNLRFYLADMDSAKYARTTINRRLSTLRSFFRWLDIFGLQSNNYVDVMSGPKILKSLPKVIRHNDIDKLLNICKIDINNSKNKIEKAAAIRDYAILECLYATGARISEIARLTINNIDFDDPKLKFYGKGKKERIVPIYDAATNILFEYINIARPILIKNVKVLTNDLCFIGNSGKPMSSDSMRKMFYLKCNKAGLSSNLSPHAMRHTFASDILDGGADLRTVQELLGHASLSTTQIYTHLSVKKLKDVHSQAHPRG